MKVLFSRFCFLMRGSPQVETPKVRGSTQSSRGLKLKSRNTLKFKELNHEFGYRRPDIFLGFSLIFFCAYAEYYFVNKPKQNMKFSFRGGFDIKEIAVVSWS